MGAEPAAAGHGEDGRIEQVGWINAEALRTLRDKSHQAVTVWAEPHNWPDFTGREKPLEVNIPLYAGGHPGSGAGAEVSG